MLIDSHGQHQRVLSNLNSWFVSRLLKDGSLFTRTEKNLMSASKYAIKPQIPLIYKERSQQEKTHQPQSSLSSAIRYIAVQHPPPGVKTQVNETRERENSTFCPGS